MTSRPSISAFFPLYNDAPTVEMIVSETKQVLETLTDDWEIILVEDCSPDESGASADRLAREDGRIKAIHHERNRGYGGALKSGLAEGKPILLEPIMNIKIRVPEEFTGDIIGDLNGKRAKVQGMSPESGINVIEAQAPQAEVLRYTIDLKSITQGRGSFTVDFSHYEAVPQHITEKIIAGRQAKKG